MSPNNLRGCLPSLPQNQAVNDASRSNPTGSTASAIASAGGGTKPETTPFKPHLAAFLRSGGVYTDKTNEGNKVDVAFYIRQRSDEIPVEAWNTTPYEESSQHPVAVLRNCPPKSIIEDEKNAYNRLNSYLFKSFNSVDEADAAIKNQNAKLNSIFRRKVILRDEYEYMDSKEWAKEDGKKSQGSIYIQQKDDDGTYSIATEQLFIDSFDTHAKGQNESFAQDKKNVLPCRRIDLWEFSHKGQPSASNAPKEVNNVGVFFKGSTKPLSVSEVGDVEKVDQILCFDLGSFELTQGADQIPYGERTLYIHSHGHATGGGEQMEDIPEGIAISTQSAYGEVLLAPVDARNTLMYPTYETLTRQTDKKYRNYLLSKLQTQQSSDESPASNFTSAILDEKENVAWAAHDHQVDIVTVKAKGLPSLADVFEVLEKKGLRSQYNHIIYGGCQSSNLGDKAKARAIGRNFSDRRNSPESVGITAITDFPARKFPPA